MKRTNLVAELINDESAKQIRNEGFIPAVIYGPNTENVHLKVEYNPFLKLFRLAGTSSIINVMVGEKKYPVLVYNLQKHPVTEKISHIDFYAIDEHKPLTTSIPLHFEGDAPGVRLHGGLLMTEKDSLEVKCLPKDLIDFISVDISTLEEVGSAIHVSHISAPEGVEILDTEEATIVHIVPPKLALAMDEEEEAAEASEETEGEGSEESEGETEGENKQEE